MLGKNSLHKFLTLITVSAVLCVYSTVAFAVPSLTTGEITVIGQVTVNGQPAVSNSTILSGETIASGPDSGAVISLGKAGTIQLAPKTTVALSFHDALVSGQLTSGSLTVRNAAHEVSITTPTGETVMLKPGETASVEGVKAADHKDANGKCIDDNKDGKLDCDNGGGLAWWAWALIFGGATAGIVWAAHNSNSADLGGGVVIVSPTR